MFLLVLVLVVFEFSGLEWLVVMVGEGVARKGSCGGDREGRGCGGGNWCGSESALDNCLL